MDEQIKRALLVVFKRVGNPIRTKYPDKAPYEWEDDEDKEDILTLFAAEDLLERTKNTQ